MFFGNLNISGLFSSLLVPFAAHSLVIQQLVTTLETEDTQEDGEKLKWCLNCWEQKVNDIE